MSPLIDVILPAHNEAPDAIASTLRALGDQARLINQVVLVDDASHPPLSVPEGVSDVTLMRLSENRGVSAARNCGTQASSADLVAFVNVEVLVERNWVQVCADYLRDNPQVGLVSAQTFVRDSESTLGRWRSLVQERKYPEQSGNISWAPGHAVMMRRTAYDEVGGFDERMMRAGEDVDICRRLVASGWEVHFVKHTSCTSIQENSLRSFANAEYNRFCWRAERGNGLVRGFRVLTRRALWRVLIHSARANWAFIPVEIGVWREGMRIAWRKR